MRIGSVLGSVIPVHCAAVSARCSVDELSVRERIKVGTMQKLAPVLEAATVSGSFYHFSRLFRGDALASLVKML